MCPCPRERAQQSPYSPGLISPSEAIVYVLLDPDHWTNGALAPAAFSKSKLAADDLSVCRNRYASAAQTYKHVVAPQIKKDPRRRVVGAVKARCGDIRDITVGNGTNERFICVIDDGLIGYPAHAVLGYSENTKQPKFWQRNSRTAVRGELTRVFNLGGGLASLEQCFDAGYVAVWFRLLSHRLKATWGALFR
jgi:hypothetical protein